MTTVFSFNNTCSNMHSNHRTILLVTIITLHLYEAATKQCQPLEEPDYGNIQYSISDETIYAQLECSSGYVSTGGCAVAECKFGKWSHKVPHCRAVECKELNRPPNGRVEFPVPSTYQSLAVYTCNTGYNLKGNDSRECLVDGVWSGMEPTCEAVGCKELNHPSNGRVQFPIPIKYQSVAVYTCSAGYDLKGTSSRECLGDGVWSGTEPTCILAATKKVDCGVPQEIDDGITKFHSTALHSKVIYRCKNPKCYSLQGDSVATCTREGKWSNDGNVPTCIRKNFNPKKIKLPERAMLKNKKAIHCGQRVRVHCPSDYKHLGAKRGTVKSRNKIKWKGKTPKCVSA